MTLYFFAHNGIGFLKDFYPFWRNATDDTDGKAGAWEWLALNHFLWQAEGGSELTDFIFEKLAQWLDELELHFFGQATYIVV